VNPPSLSLSPSPLSRTEILYRKNGRNVCGRIFANRWLEIGSSFSSLRRNLVRVHRIQREAGELFENEEIESVATRSP